MDKLEKWQERYTAAKQEQAEERSKMEWREKRLDGTHEIRSPNGQTAKKKATHVRNICFEMVETQVDSSIPQPKVTPIREEDEWLAQEIEDLLRNLLDRLPFERMNDLGERISPTQGGYYFLTGWMADAMGRGWMGQLDVELLHPMKVVPQPGVYEIRDMDYCFVDEPITVAKIRDLYGVDLSGEVEDTPEARDTEGATLSTGEVLTLHTAYFHNRQGGIGRYRWAADKELESMEDYQARRVQRCEVCGAVGDGVRCTSCGSKRFSEELEEYEELEEDIELPNGDVIPAESAARDENGLPIYDGAPELETPYDGGELLPQMEPSGPPVGIYRRAVRMEPTKIPYYSPDIYPLVLRRNVSKPGQLLGGSDVDALEDAQNGLNKVSTKVAEKVLGGGSFTAVKTGQGRFFQDGDNRFLEVSGPQDLECIRTYNTQVDVSMDLRLREDYYEEGRQTIGVTDAMQGRRDPTATSRVAKEFAASKAEGRLESKRVMKQAAFADLFEVLFRFMLAYADEPRPLISYNEDGEKIYKVFDRHHFLYQDEDGTWKYNTDFLFSCDTSAPLASNRTALWQETRMNFESGALGNPQAPETLIRFWTLMEQLHYPLAGQVLDGMRKEQEQRREMEQQAAAPGPLGMGPIQEPVPGMEVPDEMPGM